MCDMKVSPPFAVDRTSALSLIAQVSEGFRRAIVSSSGRFGTRNEAVALAHHQYAEARI